MRVLALNSSPHMERGMTAIVLHPFLDGMREAGADVELVTAHKLNIRHCQGDYSCWIQTPGRCFQQDDMQPLYSKLRAADVLVFSTPLYSDGVSGLLKDIMDRSIALMDPMVDVQDDRCHHPVPEGAIRGDLVAVSSCGLWEMDNFDPMLAHLKAWCRTANRRYAGALLRPHGSALAPRWNVPLGGILAAAREAGRQMVNARTLLPETLAAVSCELMPRDEYVARRNEGFRQRRAKLGRG